MWQGSLARAYAWASRGLRNQNVAPEAQLGGGKDEAFYQPSHPSSLASLEKANRKPLAQRAHHAREGYGLSSAVFRSPLPITPAQSNKGNCLSKLGRQKPTKCEQEQGPGTPSALLLGQPPPGVNWVEQLGSPHLGISPFLSKFRLHRQGGSQSTTGPDCCGHLPVGLEAGGAALLPRPVGSA